MSIGDEMNTTTHNPAEQQNTANTIACTILRTSHSFKKFDPKRQSKISDVGYREKKARKAF